LEKQTGRRFGPSTGLNFYVALLLAAEMAAKGETGSIVTLICDTGLRYEDTCYDPAWLQANGLDVAHHLNFLASLRA